MKYIDALPEKEIAGKKVLLRAGLDVPLDEQGEVADLFRVRQAAKTMHFLRDRGAKVIILSHIGRDPEETNEPVFRALRREIGLFFVPDILGAAAHGAIGAMGEGDVVLLENLRRDPRERKNDEGFSRELAALAELYVDDAFSVAHRAHASIVGIPNFLPSTGGLLLRDEIEHLRKARAPESPSIAILGGAKFETKAPLIKALLEKYDHVFVAGALANDVIKARGFEVGVSHVSQETPERAVLEHPHFIAPIDVTVERPEGQALVKESSAVAADERIVDIGPDSVASIAPLILAARYVLWNGPTGLYEGGYTTYTRAITRLIAEAVARGAHAAIGGGDTIAAIQDSGVPEGGIGFLSTGGGAMLEYLLKGTLPGIEALG